MIFNILKLLPSQVWEGPDMNVQFFAGFNLKVGCVLTLLQLYEELLLELDYE